MSWFVFWIIASRDVERVKGIEPSSQAWEAHILPLNHTRILLMKVYLPSLHQRRNTPIRTWRLRLRRCKGSVAKFPGSAPACSRDLLATLIVDMQQPRRLSHPDLATDVFGAAPSSRRA